MAKPNLQLVAPTTVNRTVMPKRPPNRQLRSREHLTEAEVDKLIVAVGEVQLAGFVMEAVGCR
jgi:type 1 fimbriae regulatory protein FimB/type 1 fimbriae regulatory protein FimE